MLVAVLRRPNGLFALSVEREGAFQLPSARSDLPTAGTYVERVTPLDPAAVPGGGLLAEASSALAAARPDPAALAAILHVLVGSVADPGAYEQSPAMPRLGDGPHPAAKTAAHPRGFRGTKYQPPKPPRPGACNFLPFLDGGNHEAALLGQLAAFLPNAVRDVAAHAAYGSMLADRGADVLRPLGQCWPAVSGARLTALPAGFNRYFLWAVRGMDRGDLAELIAAYWALGLDEHAGLRRLAAAMVAHSPVKTTIAWIRALEGIVPERRYAFAELLLATEAYRRDAEVAQSIVARNEALCSDVNYRHRSLSLLGTISLERSTTYILDGFELANQYAPDTEFVQHGDTRTALADVRCAMETIGKSDEHWPTTGFPLVLWERCGQLAGFGELLAELDWAALGPALALEFAELLVGTAYTDLEGEALAQKWACVRRHASAMHSLISDLAVPFRAKGTAHLAELMFLWDDPLELETGLRRYLGMLPRLCSDGFSQEAVGCNALASLTRADAGNWQRLLAAPDAAFARLEKACRRKNDSRLISDGLWSLVAKLPALTATGLASSTGALLAAAKTLGCLRVATREEVIERLLDSQLFRVVPEALGAEALVELVDESATSSSPALVSRKLRQHLLGNARLSDSQVERARRRILEGWNELLLRRVEAGAVELVAANIGLAEVPQKREATHALLFQVTAAEHRRAVRKMLKAHFSGDGDYVTRHPLNRGWFAAHPGIDPELWTHGVELRRTTEGAGTVTLSVERDPLEVLQIGTYVGSCLGLGGGMSYSAAAVALDANKQVVYCRNQRGNVIARQLLALSEAEQLFCFEVYPLEGPDEVKALFLEFDTALADALGVTIYDPDEDDEDDGSGEIALLLARDWWFDDAIRVREELGQADAAPGPPEACCQGVKPRLHL